MGAVPRQENVLVNTRLENQWSWEVLLQKWRRDTFRSHLGSARNHSIKPAIDVSRPRVLSEERRRCDRKRSEASNETRQSIASTGN